MEQDEKYIAVNFRLLLWLFLLLVFLVLTVVTAGEQEWGLSLGFGAFSLLALFGILISPLYVVFTQSSVTIVYLLGTREQILWKDVKKIYSQGSWFSRGAPPAYKLVYASREKLPFFMAGEIPKTLRTRALLKKFWKRKIL